MRPDRLEMVGFLAFKDQVVVDFAEADLFALTGPIGSGKSSVIDALVFALYGCVPRLDRRTVAPVLHLDANEARVRLDFTVDGQGYTAARVVRRTSKGGATTKEARLERTADGEVLAGNERELTAAVEELLGLGFDHFTKCVVLPQGAFQQFLHAQGSERQDLLVKLLGFELYERMAQAARVREREASLEAGVVETLIEKSAFATPEARAKAVSRIEELAAIHDVVRAAQPRLEQLRSEETGGRAEADDARRRATALAAVTVPDGLADLGAAVAAARDATGTLHQDCERAEAQLAGAEQARAQLPDRHQVEAVLAAHRKRAELTERRSGLDAALAEVAAAEEAARATCTEAESALAAAEERLDAARAGHQAHDLAASLVAGEPCPVCRQEVHQLPEPVGGATELDDAKASVVAARARRQEADAARTAAGQAHVRARAQVEAVADQLGELDTALATHPGPAEAEAERSVIEEAEVAEAAARREARAAGQEFQRARQVLDGFTAREVDLRRSFERARGELIPLGLPEIDSADLVAEWEALAGWAAREAPAHRAAAEEASARAHRAAAERQGVEAELARRCNGAGISVGAGGPGEAVAVARANAETERDRIDQALADAAEYRRQAEAHHRTAHVAGELARHLKANNFEKWVLDEALGGLVARSTELLADLSSGAYSFALEPGTSNFAVVDHRNADQVRSARTLSGGETFLASLALALALADQLAELAAHGSARLESIFIDEGFGTLDPETLDTVASAIEELGSRGRMVGLISHIPELAERVPVRFEVTRGPSTSTVEKVLV